MNKSMKTEIKETGIEGLDELLDGGIPEGHVVLVTGESGTGKTVLSVQWLFEGWKKFEYPGIYIAVTEPFTKAIKNASTMEFFEKSPLDSGNLRFTDMRTMTELVGFGGEEELSENSIDELVERIEELVEETGAKRLVIDSITGLGYMIDDKRLFRYFIFRLGAVLDGMNCTVFLTSETENGSTPFNVEDFISDGIITLDHEFRKGTVRRDLTVVKMRGKRYRGGAQTMTITEGGINVFPRLEAEKHREKEFEVEQIPTGVPNLDSLLHGGVEKGTTTLLSGPSGVGKSTTEALFVRGGADRNENSCLYLFDENMDTFTGRCESVGIPIRDMLEQGALKVREIEALEVSADEFSQVVRKDVEDEGAEIVVIDSMQGYRQSMPEQDNLLRRIHSLTRYLRSQGVTTLLTSETRKFLGGTRITEHGGTYNIDNVILLRYIVEKEGLGKAIGVLKKRLTDFEKAFRRFEITKNGVKVGEKLKGLQENLNTLSEQKNRSPEPKE